jgi:molybdate transport system regulatory protein
MRRYIKHWSMIPVRAHPPRLVGQLSLHTELGAFLGDTRIRLLEAIARHGSISRAAKAVPISYKAAWDALDAMNNLADAPLVESSIGGPKGGSTRLTEYGRRLVALYRAVEQEYREAVGRLAQEIDDVETGDQHEFRSLLKRMAMRTSARNQLVGTVAVLRLGEVNAEVALHVDDGLRVVDVVTRDSAEALGLALGKEVHALVKASAVMLTTDPDLKTSTRNQLWGQVSRVHEGPVDTEIALALPGGRTLVSVIAQQSATRLGLAPGRAACAVFQASCVILATCG